MRAGNDLGVEISYRAAADDLIVMRDLIYEAIEEKPDGLAVSICNAAALGPALHAAVTSGIPTVSLNSGSDVFHGPA